MKLWVVLSNLIALVLMLIAIGVAISVILAIADVIKEHYEKKSS